jgi:hypothetical protein
MSTIPPPMPRWWVSVNSQTEGPHSQAYIAACLSGGQIPATALLCLEGDHRWQPVSGWPQFAAYLGSAPLQAALVDPTPPLPVTAAIGDAPLIHVETRRTSTAAQIPDNVQFAAIYAKYISPIMFVLSTFTCVALLPVTYTNAISLAFVVDGLILLLEMAARLVLFIGAFALPRSPREGSGTMLWGAWLLVASTVLGVLSGFASLPGTQPADVEPPDVLLGFLCMMIPLALIEIGCMIFVLVVLHSFREQLARRR